MELSVITHCRKLVGFAVQPDVTLPRTLIVPRFRLGLLATFCQTPVLSLTCKFEKTPMSCSRLRGKGIRLFFSPRVPARCGETPPLRLRHRSQLPPVPENAGRRHACRLFLGASRRPR